MLEKLFGSRTRVKILKLFLLHPLNKYYIRQLSRDLKLQLNSVRRELDNLENFGILTSDIKEAKGEALPSSASSGSGGPLTVNSFLVGDFSSINQTGDEAKATQGASLNSDNSRVKQEKKYYRANPNFVLFDEIKALIIKAQILYEKDFVKKIQSIGSIKLLVLTGVFVSNSTATTDILLVGKINKVKFQKLIKELEKELGKEINFTIFEPREFKYRRDITDVFLYGILEGRKLIVIDEIGLS